MGPNWLRLIDIPLERLWAFGLGLKATGTCERGWRTGSATHRVVLRCLWAAPQSTQGKPNTPRRAPSVIGHHVAAQSPQAQPLLPRTHLVWSGRTEILLPLPIDRRRPARIDVNQATISCHPASSPISSLFLSSSPSRKIRTGR